MNKKFMMSTLMVALISAGLSAQETDDPLPGVDPGEGLEDEMENGMEDELESEDDLDNGLETDDELEADEELETGDDLENGLETDDELDTDEELDTEEGLTDPSEDRQDGGTVRDERDINYAQLFQRLDTNNDGVISREEARAAAEGERPEDSFPDLIEQFDRLDRDGNGELSLNEFMDFEPRFHGVR